MGKLTICVHSCDIHRPPYTGGGTVNPRVIVIVDGTYKFQTHAKVNTFHPEYNETFVVGNTHRYAIIQVMVHHCTGTSLLPVLSGLDYLRNAVVSASAIATSASATATAAAIAASSGIPVPDAADPPGGDPLVGTCYLSIRRLVRGKSKRRTFYLGTPLKHDEETLFSSYPQGVAGTISISLESDSLGELAGSINMDDDLEERYMSRLKRLFLQHDKPKIQVMDLIIAHVRDWPHQSVSTAATARYMGESRAAPDERVISVGDPRLAFVIPNRSETFEELMERLTRQYGWVEAAPFRVRVYVDGCSNLNKAALNTSVLGSDNVYVILRTESQDFVTGSLSMQSTVVWTEDNKVEFDVVNPSSFVVQVIVMGKNGVRHYEIGRTSVSVAPLARGHSSPRHMFLCDCSVAEVTTSGMVHLSMQPINFGLVPIEQVVFVDEFYDRLNKFFKRYDLSRLPLVDTFVHSRLHELEDFMQDLVVECGREPGAVRLMVTLDCVNGLLDIGGEKELDEKEVIMIVTMGRVSVRTKSRMIRHNMSCVFEERFLFDVVRETDMIRVDVVDATNEDIVYGRVDFTCLNTQRGVRNARRLYLVGAPGTRKAYLSGLVYIGLYSDEVGHAYEVDVQEENTYADRLRRYVRRRIPESLHRINLAVATVFDMETFMAQIASVYGEEDPSYALYLSILGCRQLKSRFGGINPYVVARVGVDSYQTKYVKDSTEPDYFEVCEFFFDRPEDHQITFIVMDQSEIGADREIGRVVIPLAGVVLGKHYHDFQPIYSKREKDRPKETGSVGFKYTVVNLNLVDRTRTTIVRKHRDHSAAARRQQREDIISAAPDAEIEDAVPQQSGWGTMWSAFKRQMQQRPPLLARTASLTSLNAFGRPLSSTSLDRRSDDGATRRSSLPVEKQRPTFNLMDGGIESIEEFCDVQGISAPASLHNSDDEFQDLLRQKDTTSSMFSSVSSFSVASGDDASALMDATFPGGVAASTLPKRLHVRLLYCKNVYSSSRRPPNPYLLISTARKTHRSRVEFGTTDPQYNQEFTFSVDDPTIDEMRITVLSDTPYGSKNLGHCVFSLRNVQRGQPRTRWASLVLYPNQDNATEHGSVCVTMRGENFGLEYLPSVDAENRLRERMREYLVTTVPHRLHALEWFVGAYSHRESTLMRQLFGSSSAAAIVNGATTVPLFTRKIKGDEAELDVYVKSVSKLHYGGFSAEGNCVVKVKIGRKTKGKTRPVPGTRGEFAVDEKCTVSVPDPTKTVLRFSVIMNGDQRSGECYVSLADLHKGVGQKRTHVLVQGSRSAAPVACGYITVSLRSATFGSCAAPPTVAEEARYQRLSRYYLYYVPTELVYADVKFATTLNIDAHLKKLVEKYGPEPSDYTLRITISRCVSVSNNNTDRVNPFCIIRCGLDEYRTSIVQGKNEVVFFESFDVRVGLPDKEHIELILMNYLPSRSVELGRAHIPLDRVERGVSSSVRIPIVSKLGTKSAAVNGFAEMDLFTEDFGIEATGTMARAMSTYYAPVTRSSPSQNVAPFGVDDDTMRPTYYKLDATHAVIPHPPTEGSLSGESQLAAPAASSAATGNDQAITVTLLGVSFASNSIPEKDVYVRITEKQRVLLRVKPISPGNLGSLSNVSFTVSDLAGAATSVILTLKLSVDRLVGTETLCYADFCLSHCPPNRTTEKRLRLYRLDYQFLGICRLAVSVPKVNHAMTAEWTALREGEVEPVMDDLASLVQKHSPKDLRRLDLALFRAADLRRSHKGLRQQLAPKAVATVYVAVHDISLDPPLQLRGGFTTVLATVGSLTVEATKLQRGSAVVLACGMATEGVNRLDYPLMRVDITLTGAQALMTLQVSDRTAAKSAEREVGSATVSLRALLTPKVYDMSVRVTVPLVSMRHATNRTYASLVGSITFSLIPPAFESYPASVRFPAATVRAFHREYVRYYFQRIFHQLKQYDANALLGIHAMIYETYVATGMWRTGLPEYLEGLVIRWGPEDETSTGTVPRLPDNVSTTATDHEVSLTNMDLVPVHLADR